MNRDYTTADIDAALAELEADLAATPPVLTGDAIGQYGRLTTTPILHRYFPPLCEERDAEWPDFGSDGFPDDEAFNTGVMP